MIRQVLTEIATKGSIYDQIIDTIIQPRFDLKNELISELAISFLENEKKVNQAIEQKYFVYYFIRAVKSNVHSSTSPFHKNVRIQDKLFIDNYEFEDTTDIEDKLEDEEKYKRIYRAYVKIPKTYFADYLWVEYFMKNKTFRQIGKENDISYCLVFHEVTKLKDKVKKLV